MVSRFIGVLSGLGFKGERLEMQRAGNLVVFKSN